MRFPRIIMKDDRQKKWPARYRTGHFFLESRERLLFPRRLLRRGFVRRAPARRGLFRRNVFRVHLGLFPVQHKRRVGIVTDERAAEAKPVALLQTSSI